MALSHLQLMERSSSPGDTALRQVVLDGKRKQILEGQASKEYSVMAAALILALTFFEPGNLR